ncbi:MAG TPA: primary-amine oxidase [Chloroflexota bacterium]|nr:primary-amine oxidase [Chloroflexota bacterium]
MTASSNRAEAPSAPRHPLDPLTRGEIERVSAVLRSAPGFHERMRIVSLELCEPPKEIVLGYRAGDPIQRAAFVVLLDPRDGATVEVVVSLADSAVQSWRRLTGVQPALTPEEIVACQALVRADPAFSAALRARGVENPETVTMESWTLGGFERAEEIGRRLVWTLCWGRNEPDDNPYAHPIDGLCAIVDLNSMEIVRIEDHGVVPMPKAHGKFTPEAVGTLRSDLKPLAITQPEGPSFDLDGWELRWQKWSMRIGFTPREGLVLHTISYDDGGRRRPILYRASYAELVIPYGDPGPSGYRRNAFDIGEVGIGAYANSLALGCDCLGEVRYLDVDLCDNRGHAFTIRDAVCIHEEDAGLLWKHLDAQTGHVEVRRSRRLVVSTIVTVDNYEYAFYWYFYQDGSIESEVKLTGVVVTAALPPGESSPYGRRLTDELMAPHHQHFFTARLDMMVDGLDNTVYEVHTESPPLGPENPYGGAFVTRATPLLCEAEAQQLIDPLSARRWRIANPAVLNAVGEPVAYTLLPGENVLPFLRPEAPLLRRVGHLAKHLWVTPFDPAERYPAGDYPNQHPGGAGLVEWTRANRSIEQTDVVVWYTFGSHHVSRPEDWPVMPVTRAGFMLKPDGFFDCNPALDVPPPERCH